MQTLLNCLHDNQNIPKLMHLEECPFLIFGMNQIGSFKCLAASALLLPFFTPISANFLAK